MADGEIQMKAKFHAMVEGTAEDLSLTQIFEPT